MIPSYDDLEPPIRDIGTSRRDLTAYVRRLFRGRPSERRDSAPVAAPPETALYACAHVEVGRASLPVDREACLALGRSFSPRCALEGDRTIVIDASGLGRLLGAPEQIARELHRTAAASGLAVRVAVSASRIAAVLLAQWGRADVLAVPAGGERAAIASLPVSVLRPYDEQMEGTGRTRLRGGSSRHYRMAPSPSSERDAERAAARHVPAGRTVSILERWGITTLGDFATLPPAQLSERLGERGLVLHRMARAQDMAPLVPAPPDDRFEQVMALEWPIEALEPLAFVLARLLDPLCAHLERRDRGAATIQVRLRLVTRDVHERTLQLPAPFRDPRVLRTLILLDLESHPPSAGIDEVFIKVDPTPGRVVQFSLLEHAQPSPEDLSTLVARLTALLGERRCGAPALVDAHEPGAFELRDFIAERPAPADPTAPAAVMDPPILPSMRGAGLVSGAVLRRFRVPLAARVTVERGRPVRVAAGRGLAAGAIVTSSGPWRTSGDWWQAVTFHKNEWDVALADGTIYRLFHDGDLDRWFIEGTLD